MVALRVGVLGEEMSSEEGESVIMLGVGGSAHEKMEQRRNQEETEGLWEGRGETRGGCVLEPREKAGFRRTAWSTSPESCWELDEIGLDGVHGVWRPRDHSYLAGADARWRWGPDWSRREQTEKWRQ